MILGLGERLKTLRKNRRLSQKDVANALGISAAIISNYEGGERTPSLENLVSLAGFYHCSTDYLLGFEKQIPASVIDVSSLNEAQIEILRAFINSLE
ncbi:MAG: helix-turn-helix transcriptional regulator [Lachnospiraceae bacterium]|nr:helix-turn-helix transcriptional regulator [Lachnospiraceae bacterium]